MEEPVLFEVESGIATITLNRPEKRNAINGELLALLYSYVDNVASDNAIRVAILTGNGKSFCSGIDLSVGLTENLADPRGDGRDLPVVFGDCKKPIIGAINGHAITGGLEVVLNCDFLIASERASFADTHVKMGVHPGWGMIQLLQQAVGQRMVKQMSLGGQFISAEQALRCGLVNEVVPHDELLPRAKQIAADMCAANQEMLATLKELIEYRNSATHDQALVRERQGFMDFVGGHFMKQ